VTPNVIIDPSILVTSSMTPDDSVTGPGADAVPKVKLPPGCAEELSNITVAAEAGSNEIAANDSPRKNLFIMTSATDCGEFRIRCLPEASHPSSEIVRPPVRLVLIALAGGIRR